jgi:penicillin-binding protein 2
LSEEELAHRLKSHAWFVAFAPSEDPKIAVSVIVEHGGHGSSAAAPIAREVIKTYFGYNENAKPDKVNIAGN